MINILQQKTKERNMAKERLLEMTSASDYNSDIDSNLDTAIKKLKTLCEDGVFQDLFDDKSDESDASVKLSTENPDINCNDGPEVSSEHLERDSVVNTQNTQPYERLENDDIKPVSVEQLDRKEQRDIHIKEDVSHTENDYTDSSPSDYKNNQGGNCESKKSNSMYRRYPSSDARASSINHQEMNKTPLFDVGERVSFIEMVLARQKNRNVTHQKDFREAKKKALKKSNSNHSKENTKMTTDTVVNKKTISESIMEHFDYDNATIMSEGLTTSGNMETDKNVVIFGNHEGNLRCRHLIVGECGSVQGNVDAESIEVQGVISGEVTANSVSVKETGMIEGELMCLTLNTEDGAKIVSNGFTVLPPEYIEQEHERGSDNTGSVQRRYPRVNMPGSAARSLLKEQRNRHSSNE